MGSDPSEEEIRVPRPGESRPKTVKPSPDETTNEVINASSDNEEQRHTSVVSDVADVKSILKTGNDQEPEDSELDSSPLEEIHVRDNLFTSNSETLEEKKSDDDLFANLDTKPQQVTNKTPDFLKDPTMNRMKSKSIPIESKPSKPNDDDNLSSSGGDDDLFGDLLEEETMEDILSDFKDVFVVSQDGQKPVLAGPIIDILKKQGYIKGDLETEEELQKVPEYQVLRMIIKEHPIPLNDLEERTEIESLSLVLSNLQADKLIEYTNDYKWTITSQVKATLMEFISKSKEDDEPEGGTLESAQLRRSVHRNTKFERQFTVGMYRIGIIDDLDLPLHEYMEVPEFKLLRNIKDNEPINLEFIQRDLHEVPPVQVKGIVSRLEGMGYIHKTPNDKYELSEKMIRLLVENYEF